MLLGEILFLGIWKYIPSKGFDQIRVSAVALSEYSGLMLSNDLSSILSKGSGLIDESDNISLNVSIS